LYKKNVIINHNITFTSDHNLQLKYNGKIFVNEGAILTVTNNMKIRWRGQLEINGGQVQVGTHTMYNYGKLIINDGLFTKDGSFVNKKDVILSNGCVLLTSGNFYNDEDVEGDGAIKVENGDIDNDEDWSNGVIYYFSGSGHGLPGSPSTEQEVDEVCLCNVGNCDIVPGYPAEPKVNDIIGTTSVMIIFSCAAPFRPSLLIRKNRRITFTTRPSAAFAHRSSRYCSTVDSTCRLKISIVTFATSFMH